MTEAKTRTTLGAVPEPVEAPASPQQKLDWRILVGCVLAGMAIGMALGAKLAPPRVIERTVPCQACEERARVDATVEPDEVTAGPADEENLDG